MTFFRLPLLLYWKQKHKKSFENRNRRCMNSRNSGRKLCLFIFIQTEKHKFPQDVDVYVKSIIGMYLPQCKKRWQNKSKVENGINRCKKKLHSFCVVITQHFERFISKILVIVSFVCLMSEKTSSFT